jgi:hypothetical protein
MRFLGLGLDPAARGHEDAYRHLILGGEFVVGLDVSPPLGLTQMRQAQRRNRLQPEETGSGNTAMARAKHAVPIACG